MSELLPEWPRFQAGSDAAGVRSEAIIGCRFVFGSELHVRHEYERARADAAMARLRVAVEALKARSHHLECDDPWYSCPLSGGGCIDDDQPIECNCDADFAIEALQAIGEIPRE